MSIHSREGVRGWQVYALWSMYGAPDPAYVGRLQSDPFGPALLERFRECRPDLDELSLGVTAQVGGPNRTMATQFLHSDWEAVDLCVFVRLPPGADEVEGRLRIVLAVQALLRRMGRQWGFADPLPEPALLPDEAERFEVLGRPRVSVRKPEELLVDHRRPVRPEPPPPPPSEFDVWRLFPGGVDRPVREFARRYRALRKAEKQEAAQAVRERVDEWLGALDGCATDSEAMHAVALLCGGRDVWEAALADPQPWDDGADDEERVLDIVEWV